MSEWDSAFGKSKCISQLKAWVDELWEAAGFGPAVDLTTKIDKPASFTAGNFATYNPATENLEDTGKGSVDFVQDANYLHTDNNFTNEYKDILDELPEDLNGGDKMPLLDPGVGEVGNILVVDAEGKAAIGPCPPREFRVERMTDVSDDTTFIMPSGSVLRSFDIVFVSGTPVVKLGVTEDGNEIMSERTITVDDDPINPVPKSCIAEIVLYISVSGGVVDINIDYETNYFITI
jgi:hypothetical protein